MNVHEAIRQSPDGPFISSYKYAGRRAGCHLDLEAVDGPDGDGQISEVTAALICHWYNVGLKLLNALVVAKVYVSCIPVVSDDDPDGEEMKAVNGLIADAIAEAEEGDVS